ncbi:MAG: hypothetical protein SGI97_02240 [candidate division Zixibacteria bacterium]|nr:hypothetical protein [candidate division Zixibacteria bacterium]
MNRSKFDLCVSCRAEMSRVEVERQDNLRANGLCVRCRKPRNLFSQLCDSCGALAWDNAGKNKLLQAKKEEIIAEYARLVKSRLSVVESKKTLAERYGCSVATIHKYVTKTGQ